MADVPDEVKTKLDVIMVDNIDQVFAAVLK